MTRMIEKVRNGVDTEQMFGTLDVIASRSVYELIGQVALGLRVSLS